MKEAKRNGKVGGRAKWREGERRKEKRQKERGIRVSGKRGRREEKGEGKKEKGVEEKERGRSGGRKEGVKEAERKAGEKRRHWHIYTPAIEALEAFAVMGREAGFIF